jgi:hypothetical protein
MLPDDIQCDLKASRAVRWELGGSRQACVTGMSFTWTVQNTLKPPTAYHLLQADPLAHVGWGTAVYL